MGSTAVSHGGLLSTGQKLADACSAAGNTGMSYRFHAGLIAGKTTGDALADLKRTSVVGRCWYWQNYAGFVLYGDPTVRLGANADEDAVVPSAQFRPVWHPQETATFAPFQPTPACTPPASSPATSKCRAGCMSMSSGGDQVQTTNDVWLGDGCLD